MHLIFTICTTPIRQMYKSVIWADKSAVGLCFALFFYLFSLFWLTSPYLVWYQVFVFPFTVGDDNCLCHARRFSSPWNEILYRWIVFVNESQSYSLVFLSVLVSIMPVRRLNGLDIFACQIITALAFWQFILGRIAYCRIGTNRFDFLSNWCAKS